jgi:hypothetical protein
MALRRFNESAVQSPLTTVKCCRFSDLPEDISNQVFDSMYEGYRDKDVYDIEVGFYIDEYEEASDQELYPQDEVEVFRKLKSFLIEHGCVAGEKIYLTR